MAKVQFLQLDVFTDKPGGGNPLGVVIGADAWPDAALQSFARWTDLVETTYLLPPTTPEAAYRLRIFTPSKEIAFAGHPTIGSAHAALECGFAALKDGEMAQECMAGLLPIRGVGSAAERRLYVRAPAAQILWQASTNPGSAAMNPQLQAILGTQALGALPPAFVEGGRRWWLAEFAHESDLRAWKPDHAAIRALALESDSLGLCIFARSADPAFQLAVRAFPAGVGIVEDPASGAANGLIAAYIAQAEPKGELSAGYRVSQGREMGHDASIEVVIESPDCVLVGGRTHTIIRGELDWPVHAA